MATGCIYNPPTQATCSPGSTSAGITQTTSGVGGGNITRSGDWLVSTGGSVTGTEQDGGGGAGETWIIMREYLAAGGGGPTFDIPGDWTPPVQAKQRSMIAMPNDYFPLRPLVQPATSETWIDCTTSYYRPR
jgi:hypothetical protein